MDAQEPMDVRVAHSRGALKDALRELMVEEEPQDISISRLCKTAGVSRPTFYQHFGTLDDVLAAVVHDRLSTESLRLQQDPQVEDALALALEYVQQHREELAVTLDSRRAMPRARRATIEWLRETVARSRYGMAFIELTASAQASIVFAVGGLVAVFEEQLRTDGAAQSQVEELSRITREAMDLVLPARD